jgi:hypothetical protein
VRIVVVVVVVVVMVMIVRNASDVIGDGVHVWLCVCVCMCVCFLSCVYRLLCVPSLGSLLLVGLSLDHFLLTRMCFLTLG